MRNQAQLEFWIQHGLHLDLIEPLTSLQESEVSTWLEGRTEHLEIFVKISPQSAQLEARVGKLLSRFAPGLTPEVLGFNNDLGVVVTRKLEAVNLSLEHNTEIWFESVRTLAKLQRSSLDFLPALKEAGVPILDLPALLESCRTLISDTAQLEVLGLNLEQIKQIQNLAPKIAPAVEVFEASNLPNTLVHGDFHANNVLVEHGNPKLIDWSETAISSPLLDLGRFLEFLNRKHLNIYPARVIQTELIEAFFMPWQELVSREAFNNAARVAPFIATLVFTARAWQRKTQKFMVAYHLGRAAHLL